MLMLISCTALSLAESQKAEAKETYEVISSVSVPVGEMYLNE